MDAMTFFVLVAAAMTAFTLYQGIISMAHGGAADQRDSPGLMLRRVGWQSTALALILLALLASE